MFTVSILGCGWLGHPLGKYLQQKGHHIKGATTTATKIDTLKKAHINPYLIKMTADGCAGDIRDFFDADILIITLPYRRSAGHSAYLDQIEKIGGVISRASIRFVLFTSSTGVYPDTADTYDEESPLKPQTKRQEELLLAEQILLRHPEFETTIVRLGGLYGPQRRIGQRFSAGVVKEPLPDRPVNLIHQDDAVGIMAGIIERGLWGGIYNAVGDEHPLRSELYRSIYGDDILQKFASTEKEADGKIIENAKIKQALNYQFIHSLKSYRETAQKGPL